MPYTDAFGTWIELSTVPITATNDWQLFPNPTSGTLFRIYFNTNWGDWELPTGYRSFAWLRSYYLDDAGNFTDLVSPARRIYPKQEVMMFEIPVFESLKDNPYTSRKLGFKKVRQFYPTPQLTGQEVLNYDNNEATDLGWSLFIEYLSA